MHQNGGRGLLNGGKSVGRRGSVPLPRREPVVVQSFQIVRKERRAECSTCTTFCRPDTPRQFLGLRLEASVAILHG